MGRFEQLQVFIRIVESGGIGKAAEQLNMAKSAVSRRLSELESRLECKLIQRTTRTLHLTEAGQLYYERALEVLQAAQQLDQSVQSHDQTLEGTLSLALPLTFGLMYLSPLLEQFARQYPNLTLKVDFSDREVDLIGDGIDLAFRIGDLKDSSVQARRIVPIDFVACASSDYLAEYGVPQTPNDLKSHRILKYSEHGSRQWLFYDENNQEIGVSLDSSLVANNGEFLVQMACAGQGVILVPTFIASEALSDGRLQPLLTSYHFPVLYAYAIYPQNRFLSHKARVFIDFLVEHFALGVPWNALPHDTTKREA